MEYGQEELKILLEIEEEEQKSYYNYMLQNYEEAKKLERLDEEDDY